MSWLKNQKAALDKEAAEKRNQVNEAKRFTESMWENCNRRAERFAEKCFKELEGKKTTFGKFRYVVEGHFIRFYGGDTEIGSIAFTWGENERYDNDGCAWGDGTYYDSGNLYRLLPWKDAAGKEHRNDYTSFKEGVEHCEKQLAEYLLNFVKV